MGHDNVYDTRKLYGEVASKEVNKGIERNF
ncbi:MAG: hypothetical protein ACJAS4_000020 [Bacteriovoracaceae bacterium]|jgi:hypothetical protein